MAETKRQAAIFITTKMIEELIVAGYLEIEGVHHTGTIAIKSMWLCQRHAAGQTVTLQLTGDEFPITHEDSELMTFRCRVKQQ